VALLISNDRRQSLHFICANCESCLSAELAELESENLVSEEDKTDYIPQGFAFLEQRQFWTHHQGCWCINDKDTTGMEITRYAGRTNGCCDLDGCDGPNMLCAACGYEVATARLDCWMPHCVVLEPAATRVIA
jgi:hypothetical protein